MEQNQARDIEEIVANTQDDELRDQLVAAFKNGDVEAVTTALQELKQKDIDTTSVLEDPANVDLLVKAVQANPDLADFFEDRYRKMLHAHVAGAIDHSSDSKK